MEVLKVLKVDYHSVVGSGNYWVTFVAQSQFFFKKLDFLISIGLHVLRDFRLDGIQQHVLRNASFTVHTISSKLSSISAQGRLFLTALSNIHQLFQTALSA